MQAVLDKQSETLCLTERAIADAEHLRKELESVQSRLLEQKRHQEEVEEDVNRWAQEVVEECREETRLARQDLQQMSNRLGQVCSRQTVSHDGGHDRKRGAFAREHDQPAAVHERKGEFDGAGAEAGGIDQAVMLKS